MKKVFVILIGLIIMSGCFSKNPITPGGPSPKPANATISLTIAANLNAKTIQPDLDMNIEKYDISASGPSGATVSKPDITGSTVDLDIDVAGDWQIIVEAKNKDNIKIGEGTTTVTVTAGTNTEAHVTVRPLTGTGTLKLGMSWPTGVIINPVITATLTPKNGTAQSLTFNVSSDKLSANYEDTAIQAGYYTLLVLLYDGAVLRWGAAEAVRIVAGQTSTGSYPITPPAVGTINLVIEPDMQNPISVTFSNQPQYIPLGGSLTVSVNTSQAVDSYGWYVDGILQEGQASNTITVGSNLTKGPHRLDLVVTKGNIISSGTLNFTVGAVPTPTVTITPTSIPTPTVTPTAIPTLTHSPTPTASGPKVVAITGGDSHTLALKSDGNVWAWGANSSGQLGNGTTTKSLTPISVNNLNNVIEIGAGGSYGVALKNDGTVWTWGNNYYGQLGNGTTTNSSTPIKVNNLSNITDIAAGYYHCLALKNDGTVWAWGYNYNGELGDSTTTMRTTPVRVNLITNVTAIAAGTAHSLALFNDSIVCAWGYNGYGELGINNITNWHTPVQVTAISNVKTIGAIGYSSFAIKTNNTTWVWGYNGYGGLGNGTTSQSNVPIPFDSFTTEVKSIAISAGAVHTLALLNDGSVWACGYNNNGQLGIGSNPNMPSPVQIGRLSDVQLIGSGSDSSYAVKNDGTVWAWGNNDSGQLGDGTTTTRYYPVQVNGL